MADVSGVGSPEKIAFDLMVCIATGENKSRSVGGYPFNADRKWILDTYAECLGAVRGHRHPKPKTPDV